MAKFNRTLVAEDGIAKIRTEALGDNTGQYGTKDVGSLVSLAAASCVQCSAGDDIYGQVQSVSPSTVNGGYSHGSVKQSHRIAAVVGANQGVTPMAVGDLVVADAQPALGSGQLGTVKTGTPAVHKWQCIAITNAGGTGVAGDTVLLEKA